VVAQNTNFLDQKKFAEIKIEDLYFAHLQERVLLVFDGWVVACY